MPRHITLVSTYDPEQKASTRRSSKRVDYKAPVQQFLPTPPVVVPAPVLLTETEQKWYDEIYSKCKLHNASPYLNAKVAEKLKILCLHIHTIEEIDKLYDWSLVHKWEGVEEVNIHVMTRLLNGFLQAQTRIAAQVVRTQKPTMNDDTIVWWTRCIDAKTGEPAYDGRDCDYWFLFELMPFKEAKEQYCYDPDYMPSSYRFTMESDYGRLKQGTLALPVEAEKYVEYLTFTAKKYYRASATISA